MNRPLSHERQAVPDQNLVRDARYQPDDTITRVARTIFAYRYPTLWWDSNASKDERADCLLLAAQFKEIFALEGQWTLFDAVEKLTEQSTRLLFGDQPIPPVLRVQIHDYCESFFEDLVKVFMGDGLTHLKNPLAGKSVS